ncbi:MAG: ATP-binding protein [Bacteroidaceae bacterium]|nr:ATP-binding protein [Bacteroidaceae bacterium]
MSRFRYPVDTDQFQDIRERGLLYVDKTDMMYNLANKYRYVFLARPRRFGKSLLCNTFKAYFKGQKELFEACPEPEFMVSSSNQRGLKVMELEKEWKTYPVLHFIMSGLKNCSIEEAKGKLGLLISKYEKDYGRNEAENTPGARFSGLIHRAYEQTGEKVVVILDEYDSPIMRLMYEKEQLEQMRTMLREFYQVLKDDGAYLRFVFITGVTKFSQLSIFSELNNLRQISMDDEYSGICGITQEELDTVLRPCIEEYAENLEITTDDAYALLKKNYDGYHFSPKSKDVYAPFSLLRALDGKNTYHYWFESGTSSSLLEHLRRFPITRALDYDGVAVSENEFSIPCENAETPMPLLYQSGYLTIASYDRLLQRYELKIPNNEVRKGLIDCLMPIILKRPVADNNSVVVAIAKAIFDGNLSDALTALRSYIAKIPYDIITKEEWEDKEKRESFYKLLIYMVFSLLNSIVDTEVKSILGRADVVIKTDTDIFVLELKVDDSVENALAQIDSKGYAIPYETDGRTVTKCGVCISSEQRNITHWRSVDIDGNVIDEQKFQ